MLDKDKSNLYKLTISLLIGVLVSSTALFNQRRILYRYLVIRLFASRILLDALSGCYRGGGENPGGREHLFANVYFSTMRAATDKRSSPVERVDQIIKDWPLKQRLGPSKSRNHFLWESINFWLLSISRQFFKMVSCSQKLFAHKFKHTGTYTPPSSRNRIFCLSLMSKSLYEKFNKPPGVSFSAHRPVFERFEHVVTGSPNLQITQNQCVSITKWSHGQV